jgi:hypothetical protein
MFSRQQGQPRRGLAGLVLSVLMSVAALSFGASVGTAQIVDTPIPEDPVAIDSGAVSGKTLPSGVTAYFGIPYAAAPVRDLRWHEAQPVQAWNGVYHADRMASECIQVLRHHNLDHYFGEEATSEDCLKALGAGSLAEMRLSPRAKERPRPAPKPGRWNSARPARLRSTCICFRDFSSRDPVSASLENIQAYENRSKRGQRYVIDDPPERLFAAGRDRAGLRPGSDQAWC